MSVSLKGTLVLVGAGKMGSAMLEGWLASGADPKMIVALDPFASDEMKALLNKHGVASVSQYDHWGGECDACTSVRPSARSGQAFFYWLLLI